MGVMGKILTLWNKAQRMPYYETNEGYLNSLDKQYISITFNNTSTDRHFLGTDEYFILKFTKEYLERINYDQEPWKSLIGESLPDDYLLEGLRHTDRIRYEEYDKRDPNRFVRDRGGTYKLSYTKLCQEIPQFGNKYKSTPKYFDYTSYNIDGFSNIHSNFYDEWILYSLNKPNKLFFLRLDKPYIPHQGYRWNSSSQLVFDEINLDNEKYWEEFINVKGICSPEIKRTFLWDIESDIIIKHKSNKYEQEAYGFYKSRINQKIYMPIQPFN